MRSQHDAPGLMEGGALRLQLTIAERPGAWMTGMRALRHCAPSLMPLACEGGRSTVFAAACFESLVCPSRTCDSRA